MIGSYNGPNRILTPAKKFLEMRVDQRRRRNLLHSYTYILANGFSDFYTPVHDHNHYELISIVNPKLLKYINSDL